MSSVLHPVGPEPRERYWVRRLAVLIAAVVAIGIVIALVGNAMSAGSAVQAEPAPPSVVAPTLPPVTPSASPSVDVTASPTPGSTDTPTAGTTASPTPGAATTRPSASASPTDGSVVTPKPGQKTKTEKATPPTAAEKKKAEAAAEAKKAAAKKKAKATVLATCPTDDLRPTLTGPKKVKAKKSATFAVSLINGSSKSCYLKVTNANYTLTIVSGKDKIWSTEDCPAAVPAQSRKLTSQKSLDWKIKWNGQRSGDGCSKEREAPKAGYYWAIANFDDAKEVRWRIILT
ncbi:RodZ family helix-turn-helix domain-containing protein [Microlunatus antarcticus]|uniref:Type IV secretory pathway VirB10-like protein n=1 Tax=Microlunatus antarcticus TaxID=53388 RepID=A0A7W5JSE4_9ACTN|nr:hypothetical protein [Microlunatus antarcticus]MBB3325353.1 type IV secretory pathway VirB10-like protein [Microlunatus antarcticus]